MMTQTIKRTGRVSVAVLCASVLALTGCGSSFQSSGSAGASNTPGGNNGSGGGTPGGNQEWEKLSMDGKLSFGRFGGRRVVSIDKVTKELVVSLPMPANSFIDGLSIAAPVPQIPGAKFGLEAIPGGGSALVLRVPLSHLLQKVAFTEPSKLPNGDPLPRIADGEMPSIAVQLNEIKNIKATFYLAVQTLGIFVNTPFDPFFTMEIPIMSEDGVRTLGYLHLIPAKKAPLAPADGGFFLSIQIPDEFARIIDDNV